MKELFYDYNLQLLSIDSNSINPYSPSFYYGYSIYETIFIKESKPVFYNEHVDRLKKSAGYFKFEFPKDFFYELKNRINRILKENEVNDGKLRLVVFLEKDKSLSSILFTDTIKKFPDSISLYISSYKKPFPPIFPSFVKITSNLTSHLSANEAKENGFDEGIILDTKDQITEGSYCNLFFQKGDKFYTPSNELAILDGVTRSKIIETLNTLKIQIIENALDKNFIFECDYAYISSSSRGLLPVNKINNRIFDINRSSLISSIKREYENLQESSISKW